MLAAGTAAEELAEGDLFRFASCLLLHLAPFLQLPLFAHWTMLLTRVSRSSSRGFSREPRLDGFLILALTPDCNLPVSLRHQVAVRTRLITRVSRIISIEGMLHTIAISKLFEKVFPQEVLNNRFGNPSKGSVPLIQEYLSLLPLGHFTKQICLGL